VQKFETGISRQTKMMNQTDQETFFGLKARDNHAYEILYAFYYPSVRHFIVKNNGTVDDAKDIFQETICVLLEKVPKDDFNLTSSLKTYIFAISSNLWLKRLREANKTIKSDIDVYEKYLTDYEEAEAEVHENNESRALKVFKIITNKCITLLKAIFYDEKNIDTVTKEFGYTNKHNAQNQKFKCLEQARKGSANLS
jgi:RNA polymerase sigma factor (sigma-70 family)